MDRASEAGSAEDINSGRKRDAFWSLRQKLEQHMDSANGL
jgi:hypothetical protein